MIVNPFAKVLRDGLRKSVFKGRIIIQYQKTRARKTIRYFCTGPIGLTVNHCESD